MSERYPKNVFESKPNKPWWSGDPRVEPFMPIVHETIKKYVTDSDHVAEIYNRAYEAVYKAVVKYDGNEKS